MKIGDLEVQDAVIEQTVKAMGKRLVDDSDYVTKAEAAAELAKWRKVTGDNRSLDDIAQILKTHEENEQKTKTETELLKTTNSELQKRLEKMEAEMRKATREAKKVTVREAFDKMAQELEVKVIDPILEKHRQAFYDLDETKMSAEELKTKVTEALKAAATEQSKELQRLGIPGNQDSRMDVGGGMLETNPEKIAQNAWDIIKSSTADANPFSPFQQEASQRHIHHGG